MTLTTELRRLSVLDRVRLFPTLCRTIAEQVRQKRGADVRAHDGAEAPHPPAVAVSRWQRYIRRGRNVLAFFQRMLVWDTDLLRRCCHHLRSVRAAGEKEVVLYGEGQAAELIWRCAPLANVRISAVCPWGLPESRLPQSLWQWPETALVNWKGSIVIAAFVNSQRHIDRLTVLGVPRDRMIVLE